MIPPRPSTSRRGARIAGLAACAVLASAPLETASAVESLAARVEGAAAEAARAAVAAPDRFEVLSSRFAGADPVDPAAIRLGPAQVEGPNRLGVFQVRFRMTADGAPRGEARANVRGRLRGPALRAGRTLLRGRAIEPSDVELVEADLTRLGAKPLRAPEQALGQVPLRTLGMGRVITGELLGPAPVVERGQLVELRIERERMTIRALGTALRAGAPGDVVPAENNATGVKLEGVVQEDGSLLVPRHGGAERWGP